MIDLIFISKLVASYFGAWAMGFSVGKSVAWTRAIRNAA